MKEPSGLKPILSRNQFTGLPWNLEFAQSNLEFGIWHELRRAFCRKLKNFLELASYSTSVEVQMASLSTKIAVHNLQIFHYGCRGKPYSSPNILIILKPSHDNPSSTFYFSPASQYASTNNPRLLLRSLSWHRLVCRNSN